MTVAQRTFTVFQSGVAPSACDNTIAPAASSVPAAGGTGTVTITAGSECVWNAVSNTSWLTITSASSGIGNGSVTYSAASNNTGATRKGTLTIAGRTFNVKQKGT
jgi:hypothetical protein